MRGKGGKGRERKIYKKSCLRSYDTLFLLLKTQENKKKSERYFYFISSSEFSFLLTQKGFFFSLLLLVFLFLCLMGSKLGLARYCLCTLISPIVACGKEEKEGEQEEG